MNGKTTGMGAGVTIGRESDCVVMFSAGVVEYEVQLDGGTFDRQATVRKCRRL